MGNIETFDRKGKMRAIQNIARIFNKGISVDSCCKKYTLYCGNNCTAQVSKMASQCSGGYLDAGTIF